MRYFLTCCSLFFVTGIVAQVPAPTYSSGSANSDMNWTMARSYDGQGNVIGESKKFYNKNGALLQSQVKLKYRKNSSTVYTHVFAGQTLFDVYGRPAGTTFPAPINSSEFIYISDFMRNTSGAAYSYKDFDRYKQFTSGSETDKTTSPDPVGTATIGTLGWYYSNNNTWEPYMATTDYPYARETFYSDGTGNVKKNASGGDVFRMGSGKETISYITPVASELDEYIAIRNKFFPTELGAATSSITNKAIQIVSKDVDGRESAMLQDKGGKILMSAIPGTELTASNTVSVQPAYVYSFQGTVAGNYANDLKVTGNSIRIYESQNNGTSYTLIYNGTAGSYSSSSSLPYLYKIESNQPFFVSYDVAVPSLPDRQVCKDCPSQASDFAFYSFKLFSSATVTITGGAFDLYDMNTEQVISFTSGSTLAAGYYKIVNTATTPITLSYANGYADVSYSYYNQLGQLVATIAPEGVKLLHGTGINNYLTKNNVPFIDLNEYDAQGRLVKVTTTDGGTSEFVYRQDGKIRFSQNAEQQTTGRYSYMVYDTYGRMTETGEYQPDGSGIAFNSDMAATTNPMRDILENTTGTGGLTTGTKKDVLQSVYDVPDATHGLSGYTQDASYIAGAISTTRKYSTIVNNSPNSVNLVSATWYNYDEEGRVVWQVQMMPNLGGGSLYRTTDYSYDMSGRLVKKVFQAGTSADTFVHYYEYDPSTNKLWKLYTNTVDNSSTKKLQATYIYYLHGPLKRIELAGTLQGIDYTYTLQGGLKAINNSDKTKDPGGDGSNGFNADAYGMVLNYYTGDYLNGRSSGVQPIKSVDVSGITTDSYTGTIQAMTWFSKKPSLPGLNDDAVTYVYKYDDKYQFKESVWGTGINFSNTPASFTTTSYNKETVVDPTSGLPAYDANGNILKLQRTNTAGAYVDKFAYNYVTNTNKLQSVVNTVTGSPVNHADYTYDARGQLTIENTGDPAKKKYIRYDVSGNVVAVARDASFSNLVVEFVYNEIGQRIIKKSYNSSYQLTEVTYYAGDAIFTQSVSGGSTFGTIVPQEYEIEGGATGRLGLYYRQAGVYAYELNDHLGNVRAVIAEDVSGYIVKMYSDYYPYGMTVQSGGDSYRYGFQGKHAEKDGETDWNAFELRMYDSKIGRWLSTDPEGQYHSSYVGMGNSPVNGVDKNGGFWQELANWLDSGAFFWGKWISNAGRDKYITLVAEDKDPHYKWSGDRFTGYGTLSYLEGTTFMAYACDGSGEGSTCYPNQEVLDFRKITYQAIRDNIFEMNGVKYSFSANLEATVTAGLRLSNAIFKLPGFDYDINLYSIELGHYSLLEGKGMQWVPGWAIRYSKETSGIAVSFGLGMEYSRSYYDNKPGVEHSLETSVGPFFTKVVMDKVNNYANLIVGAKWEHKWAVGVGFTSSASIQFEPAVAGVHY